MTRQRTPLYPLTRTRSHLREPDEEATGPPRTRSATTSLDALFLGHLVLRRKKGPTPDLNDGLLLGQRGQVSPLKFNTLSELPVS